MEKEVTKSLLIKSTFMMVVGSLLFGLIIARGVYEYQKNNFVLDEVVVINEENDLEVAVEEEKGFSPLTFLDLSSPEHTLEPESKVIEKVQTHVEEQYGGDTVEMEMYFERMPKHIRIPSIGLDSDIGLAGLRDVEVFGKTYQQWIAPDEVVGWHFKSALLGVPGNTVLNGHHNISGEIFKNLHKVQLGDEIILRSDTREHRYAVVSLMILPERFEPEKVRQQNAKWIQTSEDERVTLVTCWPYESNTHRVIVVAYPIDNQTAAHEGN